ncbi:MAG TPA: Fic family protein [Acidimicrobiales bacterium]|nr:Fic family protein [Acidimicrobiales bacterium]
MGEPSLSDEADDLYQPLARWSDDPVDEPAWRAALDRLDGIRRQDPEWAELVAQGAQLAAAYQSGALDGAHAGDREVALALLRGEASLASMDEEVRAHVRANLEALELARTTAVWEGGLREVHQVACRPQLTHRVLVEGRAQDHVMAHGDYKHHPNHILLADGTWRATAPVAQLQAEMAHLLALAERAEVAGLHPLTHAAWLHDAVLHVQPFADGNGRVARALAGGVLLRAGAVPMVAFEQDVDVLGAVVDLVGLMETADRSALAGWQDRSKAAEDLRRRAVEALGPALRGDHGARRADVSGATIGDDLVVRIAGVDVDERLVVDAHPLDDGPVSITAREAALRLVADDDIERWADRVAATLALRVAAESD